MSFATVETMSSPGVSPPRSSGPTGAVWHNCWKLGKLLEELPDGCYEPSNHWNPMKLYALYFKVYIYIYILMMMIIIIIVMYIYIQTYVVFVYVSTIMMICVTFSQQVVCVRLQSWSLYSTHVITCLSSRAVATKCHIGQLLLIPGNTLRMGLLLSSLSLSLSLSSIS